MKDAPLRVALAGVRMPINRLLNESKLTPEEIAVLNRAFEYALRSLGLVDRNDPITEIVARKIIDVSTADLRDPAKISEITLRQLKA
jgi:hypothetical protein